MDWKGPAAAVFYGASSTAIILFNKATLSSFEGSFPLGLALGQALAGVILFYLYDLLRPGGTSLSWSLIRPMLLVSGTNALGVAASFLSLQYVSVPTYGMLKRASIVFTMMFDWWLHERKPSTAILHSVAIMAVGALLMGFTDLSFSFIGYAAGIASSAFQSLFLVLSNKYFSDQHLSAMDSAKVHCAASVPAHALLFLLSTEPSEMLSPATWSNPGFASCFAASCVLGVALIASTQICSLVNTPLTVVVTGNAKSVGQALLGILLFGSRHPPLNVLGIVIGFLGSFYYAKSKWDEQQSRARSKVTS